MPYFKEACDLVLRATTYIRDALIVWDVSITLSEPSIIEGNINAGLFWSDVAFGGLLKNPHMKKLLGA
ncbi:MAG TPA: hypothetical protein ENH87_12835 [Pricia antarctica]|uniref:Sugar-transfer associated ATP-grasp n=1 Tax=Pricia antarctica TaxID=641691 RepID=A0A831QSC0_9FLAO|nr:hypothetical protein [Pricia antarctica]